MEQKSQKKSPALIHIRPTSLHVSLNRNTADSVIKREEKTKREVKKGGGHPGIQEEVKEGGESQFRRQQKIIGLFQYIASTVFPLFSLPVRLLRSNSRLFNKSGHDEKG